MHTYLQKYMSDRFLHRRQQHDRCYNMPLVYILQMLVLLAQPILAEVAVGQHSFTGYRLFDMDNMVSFDASLGYIPVAVEFRQNCQLSNTTLLPSSGQASKDRLYVGVIPWDSAVSAGCFTYAQIIDRFLGTDKTGAMSQISGLILGSSVSDKDAEIGSPLVEPYGDLKSLDTGELRVAIVQKSTAQMLLSQSNNDTDNSSAAQVYITDAPGPWNLITKTTGYTAQKYLFKVVSILLILYTFWEIGLMLCTRTVWNRRMLMYVSAIGYLIVFTLLQPYGINGKASKIVIYVSWILGYMSFTLFVTAWGSLVEKIHRKMATLWIYRITHYISAIIVSLTMLMKIWGFARESYPFAHITNQIVVYEMPVVFGLQTCLLGFLVWAFLCRTYEIAISHYAKSVLRNFSILCIIALCGCLCIVFMSIIIATPIRYSVGGYMATVVLYQLGQCLLFCAIFAAFWVRDHAKRTRPMFHEHEFYAEANRRTFPTQQPTTFSATYHRSQHHVQLGNSQQNLRQSIEMAHQSAAHSDIDGQSSMSNLNLSPAASVARLGSVANLLESNQQPNSLKRKPSQRHVYVPLDSATVQKMQESKQT